MADDQTGTSSNAGPESGRGDPWPPGSAEETEHVPYGRLLSYVKPYKLRFGLSILFGVISGAFNAVLLFTLKVVFAVILSGEGEAVRPFADLDLPLFPGFLRELTLTPPAGQAQWIWVAGVCGLVPLMILIRGLLEYLQQYFILWVGNRILFQLRDEVYSNLLRQSLGFFTKAKTGQLMQTVFLQTQTAQQGGTQLAGDLVKHPISILSIVCVLLTLDWLYTLAALVIFPACILPVAAISKKVRKAGGREETETGGLMAAMQETFAGIRVVKSAAREDYERERFNAAHRRVLAFIMRWRKAVEVTGPLVETVASIGMAAGLIYAKVTNMGIDTFLLLNMSLMSMYPHAKALSRVQNTMHRALAATSRVFALIDAKPDIMDAPDALELRQPRGDIGFHGVSFTYPAAEVPALDEINLTLQSGRNYALVGKSGSGKSTLLYLMMRFYDPQKGSITFDGVDLRRLKQQSLRDHIGIVTQEVFLFHDTIENNIRYGNPRASREEIVEAARRAYAHEFIQDKPMGYQTLVGDKGTTLSGGQQQRVSIARAILRNAPVLLLDEAYSSLDSESEKKIHEAIEGLSAGKTVIAIAHRLSTVLKADQIIVMDAGRIVGRGTHAELLAENPVYQRLYNLQFESHNSGPAAVTSVA